MYRSPKARSKNARSEKILTGVLATWLILRVRVQTVTKKLYKPNTAAELRKEKKKTLGRFIFDIFTFLIFLFHFFIINRCKTNVAVAVNKRNFWDVGHDVQPNVSPTP